MDIFLCESDLIFGFFIFEWEADKNRDAGDNVVIIDSYVFFVVDLKFDKVPKYFFESLAFRRTNIIILARLNWVFGNDSNRSF